MTGNQPVHTNNNFAPKSGLTHSSTENDKIIASLRISLESFIEKLATNNNNYEVLRPKTVLSSHDNVIDSTAYSTQQSTDRLSLTQNVLDLDEEIDALLAFIGSQFSVWIFDDFVNSIPLQNTLWKSFYYTVIKNYQHHVIDRPSNFTFSTEAENEQARQLARNRFVKLCKHISHYYKVLITRMVETYGYTPQILYVVSVLQVEPENLNTSPIANQSITPILHTSIHDSLCHMGDLSRYRSMLHPSSNEILSDYKHSIIYYTTASKIRPSSGVPLNLLGNISFSRGDVFTATYYFLRSVAVDEPFQDGPANLRIILRKLIKLKNLSEKPFFGLKEADEGDCLNDVDTDNSNTSNSQKEVKETLLQIIQLYSTYYLAQLPAKASSDPSKLYDPNSEDRQQELTDRLYELCKDREIPSRIISKLVIISITFIWLLHQSCDAESKRDPKKISNAVLTPQKAYKLVVSFTLRIFDKLLSAALRNVSASGERKKLSPGMASLLPAFRILMDWLHKQLAGSAITEWGQDSTQCNAIFLKAWQLLEHLREVYGFRFDIFTAVARSNWDRFEEILKRQKENVSQEVDRKVLAENYEETHCLGLTPLDGGISDTPTGLDPAESLLRTEQDIYRSQCLLFSGVEISRLYLTFLSLDEFKGQDAHFSFEPIDFENFVSDEEEEEEEEEEEPFQYADIPKAPQGFGKSSVSDNKTFESGNGNQISGYMNNAGEEVVDESEYYKIGRNDAVFRNTTDEDISRNSQFNGNNSHNNGNGQHRALFPKFSEMNSASPAFLSRLYNLEHAQFSHKGRRSHSDGRNNNRGHNLRPSESPLRQNGQGSRAVSSNSSNNTNIGNDADFPKRRRRRRRGRRTRQQKKEDVSPEDKEEDEDEEEDGSGNVVLNKAVSRMRQLDLNDVEDDDEDDGEDDSDDSDEEVVFQGRGRGRVTS